MNIYKITTRHREPIFVCAQNMEAAVRRAQTVREGVLTEVVLIAQDVYFMDSIVNTTQ